MRTIIAAIVAVMCWFGVASTLFLWNRYEPDFSIHPSSQGAGASAVFTTPW